MGEDSSPPPPEKSNMPVLYYGLVVVGTATIVLAIFYNLIIIKWCANRRAQRSNRLLDTTTTSQSFEDSSVNLVASFKYKKEAGGANQEQLKTSDYECAVCLSVFEDGEDVRELPRCKHSFHAQCIDMWLYSHFDCPLCRAPVEPGVLPHQHRDSFEISREGFLESGIPVWRFPILSFLFFFCLEWVKFNSLLWIMTSCLDCGDVHDNIKELVRKMVAWAVQMCFDWRNVYIWPKYFMCYPCRQTLYL